VTEPVVTFIGPRQAWVVARVVIDEALNGPSVEELARAAEHVLRRKTPVIAQVDLEPQGR
jgi:hypothetical protein